jgi:hypothetical protein
MILFQAYTEVNLRILPIKAKIQAWESNGYVSLFNTKLLELKWLGSAENWKEAILFLMWAWKNYRHFTL